MTFGVCKRLHQKISQGTSVMQFELENPKTGKRGSCYQFAPDTLTKDSAEGKYAPGEWFSGEKRLQIYWPPLSGRASAV